VYLVLASGAYVIKKGIIIKVQIILEKSQETVYEIGMSIFLSLYLKNSAIALGATPIGSAGHAPDRKKLTKRR
jgi:hypothetical protein